MHPFFPALRRTASFALALALAAAPLAHAAAPGKATPPSVAAPALPATTLPVVSNEGGVDVVGARRMDFTSKITGRTYRLFVAPAAGVDPAKPAPVLYVIDGNVYFTLVADALRYWSAFGDGIAPAIVVGIGYPTDSVPEMMTRRMQDLTQTPPPADDPNARKFLPPGAQYGDLDRFLEMLDREVKPLIASRYRVDSANAALLGHSLGGLAVVRALYTRPDSYRSFLALSPSIWWNRSSVLQDEPAFLERVRAHRFAGRVYVAIGSREEHQYDKPPLGLSDEDAARILAEARMVGNARHFARRLEAAGAAVRYDEFANHTHLSLPWVAVRPALDMALPAAP